MISIKEKKPKILYLRAADEIAYTAECIAALSEHCQLVPCYSFADLAGLLNPDIEFVAIHIDFIDQCGISIAEWSHMFSTITHLVKFKTPLVKRIIIRKTTSVETIAQLKKSIISGILLSVEEHDLNEVVYSLTQMLDRTPFWPKRIIDSLPGSVTKTPVVVGLTSRQQQVLQLVCQRGLSNKVIAKMLSISENTVKVHISAILKTYGVKSRTQLAVFTKSCNGSMCSTCTKI